jgi:lysophospholipase L1-like esterase
VKKILAIIILIFIESCNKDSLSGPEIIQPVHTFIAWSLQPGKYIGEWAGNSCFSNQIISRNRYLYRCITNTVTDPELLYPPFWQKLGPNLGIFNASYPNGYLNGDGVISGTSVYLSNVQQNTRHLRDTNETKQLDGTSPIKIVWWGDSLTLGEGSTGGGDAPHDLAVITGFNVENEGVNGETSSQIKRRVFADRSLRGFPAIIWAGRNNYTHPDVIEKDIAGMVTVLGHKQYLILGVLKSNYMQEPEVDELNFTLKKTYGKRFVDIQQYLLDRYNPTISLDVKAHETGNIAWSLHSDWLHLNNDGYLLVAQCVAEKITILMDN